jgi:hypothetical protein
MSHVTPSHEVHVCIPRATLSKIGMRWTRIAPESLRDGLAIWIDSRLISYQSFMSPIVPAVSVVAYLGLEDCGTLAVGTRAFAARQTGWPRGFGECRPNSRSLHKILDRLASA